MNQHLRNMKIICLAVCLPLIMTVGASADMGRSYGYRGPMHHGPGWHHGGYDASGWGSFSNLSEEDARKLEEEQQAFFEDTKDLRRQVYQKRLELASEMARQDPDAARAAAIQREISNTIAQLAQKHLEHLFRVRKINPDLGMGFMGRGHWGSGMMHPGMMGGGGPGFWGNPDCPYGGPGGGYGKGPGMKGPDGWSRDDSRQYHRGPRTMSE